MNATSDVAVTRGTLISLICTLVALGGLFALGFTYIVNGNGVAGAIYIAAAAFYGRER